MTEQILRGIPASDGIAIGRVFCYIPAELNIPVCAAGTVDEEMSRFDKARACAHTELQNLYDAVEKRAGKEEASIFEAHQQMLYDPALEGKIREFVEIGLTVEQALVNATEELANLLAAMGDELFAARALDVKDVGRRLLRVLLGLPDTALSAVVEPSIIIAEDLTPSDTASLDPKLTLGFITSQGGLTSHSAILARTLGLPAIVGMGDGVLGQISNGMSIVMDGRTGEMLVEPNEETVKHYQQIKATRESHLQILKGCRGKGSLYGERSPCGGRREHWRSLVCARCDRTWRRRHWLAAYGIPLSRRYTASQRRKAISHLSSDLRSHVWSPCDRAHAGYRWG